MILNVLQDNHVEERSDSYLQNYGPSFEFGRSLKMYNYFKYFLLHIGNTFFDAEGF